MARTGALRGVLAASVTPLTPDGTAVDTVGIGSLVDFYSASGLDGLLILGTTGEGVLLSVDERQTVAEAFMSVAAGRLPVIVHCGAQSTRDTVALAAHATANDADGVAVIPPPYYAFDSVSIHDHLAAAARACAPLPFYAYEFAARSGYAIPRSVIEALMKTEPNFAGIKVSDPTFDQVAAYLIDGLDVFIGAEALIHRGMQVGASGAVSGLAAAFPEVTIAAVRSPSEATSEEAARVRGMVQRYPFHAALKAILRRRGVNITDGVRAPLRALDDRQRAELARMLDQSTIVSTAAPAP